LWNEAIVATFRDAGSAGASTVATDGLVLEHPQAFRETLDRHGEDLRKIKGRLSILESQIGTLTAQYASLSNRIDRMDERVARIEKRLELVGT
jgi:predicted  nucleic acid-binding Zn-ribbon protein